MTITPPSDTTIFSPHLRPQLIAYTKHILKRFSDEFSIPYEDMLECINQEFCPDVHAHIGNKQNEKQSGSADTCTNDVNCAALLDKNGKSVRCSRKRTTGNFCKTHAKMHQAGKLEKDDKRNTNTKTSASSENVKGQGQLELIMIDDANYLYDYISKKVYTFESTPSYVGVLDDHEMRIIPPLKGALSQTLSKF